MHTQMHEAHSSISKELGELSVCNSECTQELSVCNHSMNESYSLQRLFFHACTGWTV